MIEYVPAPEELRKLPKEELPALAEEIREKIIDTVSKNGGHLASNLGTVELTLALHYAFDTPRDTLVFDVGHQCYAHKLITGRGDSFDTLRQAGGLSGFSNREESEYDTVTAGHSGPSVSAAALGNLLPNIILRCSRAYVIFSDLEIYSEKSGRLIIASRAGIASESIVFTAKSPINKSLAPE